MPEKDKRSNKRKALLMGMPIGTAANRLRKKVMFMLVCQCGLDTCYRCDLPIETEAELSIEHKDSWQAAADHCAAFFDLANVAFSHLSCNVSAASHPNKRFESEPERRRAWSAKNRKVLTAKRDAWRKQRRESGLPVK